MVLNIDLAPTFLDIAGVKIPKDMDGVSIMKLFRKTRYGRRAKRYTVTSLCLASGTQNRNSYSGLLLSESM